jgi:hypothetical protein
MMSRIVFHGRVSQGDNIIVSSYLYNPAIIKSLLYNSFLITPLFLSQYLRYLGVVF